jgi:hypothetical protein
MGRTELKAGVFRNEGGLALAIIIYTDSKLQFK